MKKILLVTTTLFILVSFQDKQQKEKKQDKEHKEVFICASVASNRYHLNKTCKGLAKCDTTIIKKTTKKKAEQFGRTLCKWED